MIAIKGIELPETCFDCPCCDKINPVFGAYYCRASQRYCSTKDQCLHKRQEWCPLLPVDGIINHDQQPYDMWQWCDCEYTDEKERAAWICGWLDLAIQARLWADSLDNGLAEVKPDGKGGWTWSYNPKTKEKNDEEKRI